MMIETITDVKCALFFFQYKYLIAYQKKKHHLYQTMGNCLSLHIEHIVSEVGKSKEIQ